MGANVSAAEKRLLEAAEKGLNDAVRAALSEGASLSCADVDEDTPLHLAALYGHTGTVKLLLNWGANREALSKLRNTPLHRAAWKGHTGTVELLLYRGANREALNEYGSTPLHCAALNGHTGTVEQLLNRGADQEAVNKLGYTPLHYASWNGHTGTVELLLDRGADREALTNLGYTPLHRAAGGGHTGTVELLLDRGADREALTNDGRTPLHYAAREGHTGTVELLLDRGADREALTKEGKTPLDVASNEEIKALLRGASAAAEREKAEAARLAAEREKEFEEWVRAHLAELGMIDEKDVAACFQFLAKNVKSIVLLSKISQSRFAAMVEASGVGVALEEALKHMHSQLSPPSAAASAGAVLAVDWATHRRSSGASSIADAEYTLGNDMLPVKVKTAQRSSPGFRLDHEHNVLKKFSCHEMTKGLFVACHDYIDGVDRVSVRNGPAFPPDQTFLVLERGSRNLTEYVRENRQRENTFKDHMLDVLAIIASAHSAQYVLMDVKGSNFVLFPVRHGDTAVLKAIDVEGAVGIGEDIGSTGAVVTPSSAPPELFREGPVQAHPSVDIWALGIMCCELLTDQPFWLRAGLHTDAEIAARLAEVTQADIDGMLSRSEIPKVWMKFVSACLAVDPSARPSAAALLSNEVFSGASSVTASKFMQQFKAVTESISAVGRGVGAIGATVREQGHRLEHTEARAAEAFAVSYTALNK